MTYRDCQKREMAKWAHHRLNTARRRAEEEQREAFADLDESRLVPGLNANAEIDEHGGCGVSADR